MTEMHTRDLPMADPAPHLSPTAQRILSAAREILMRDGFDALTFEAIAKESGENRASIRYHFGSKAGLVSTLVDAVMYEESLMLIEAVSGAAAGAERRRALLAAHRQIATHLADYRQFFDLIPRILRDELLLDSFRRLFIWYRDLDVWALAGDDAGAEKFRPLGTLAVAMLDGLALQYQADPSFDLTPAFDLWERMVMDYAEQLEAGGR